MEKQRKPPRVFIWSERNFNKTNSFDSYFSSSPRGIPQTTFCLLSWQPTTVILALLLGSLLNQYIILPRLKFGKPDHMKQILLRSWWQIQPVSFTPSSIQAYLIPTITSHWYQDQNHCNCQVWPMSREFVLRLLNISMNYIWFHFT